MTAYLLNLGETPYLEAWELQRTLAGAVSQDAIPDTVVMLEHPPVITLGRLTDGDEVHVPAGAEVEVVETDLRDDDGKHVARVTQTQAVLGG